ncbi:MAG: hypothetical protein WC249_02745 [Patescibacteria group bacterium]|jgi:hypothetical protein
MSPTNAQYLKWTVPEYHKPERSRNWYIIAGIFIFICLFFSFFTISGWQIIWLGLKANFLFSLIIIISAIMIIINDSRTPNQVNIEIGPEGVKVGHDFYDYNVFKNFTVLYKPKESLKNLYFEFKNSMRPRISLPLRRLDALTVRNFLIKYLDEDLERTEMPLSEQLTKLLKL